MVFYDNEPEIENTIQKTIDFLKKAERLAKEGGFEDVVVTPSYTEQTADNLEQHYIQVIGWRLETDEEYLRRLNHHLAQRHTDKAIFVLKQKYYETPNHQIMIDKLNAAITAIKPKKKK